MPPRHHDRHPGDRCNVPGKLQKISLAGQGTAITGLPVHGRRLITPARQFDQVNTKQIQHGNDLLRIINVKATPLEISRVDLDRNGKIRPDDLPYSRHDDPQQTGPVFQAATPAVSALVGKGG